MKRGKWGNGGGNLARPHTWLLWVNDACSDNHGQSRSVARGNSRMWSCCVVWQKYLIIKQLKIRHDLKGICYPSWVIAPHSFPYLGAAHVAEPVRSVRSQRQRLGGLHQALWPQWSCKAHQLQSLVHAPNRSWMEEELILMENSDLLYKSKVQTRQF